jgi:hypothetical protein
MQKRSLYPIFVIAITLVLVVVFTFGAARPVQAADIRNTGVLNSGETVDDDLIISGQQVRVDGTVNGLLIAVGQTVTLNGTINGDALLFAQDVIVSEKAVIKGNLYSGARTIVVNGEVAGSIAGGSASMVTGAKVGRNIYYGGYSLETQTGNSVARGLYFGGYQAVLKGSIARDLNASAGAVELDGAVGGDALIRVSAPGQRNPSYFFGPYGAQIPAAISSGLRVGPNAKISGKLAYTSEANQDTAIQGRPEGGIVYLTPVPNERGARPTQPAPAGPFLSALNWLVSFLRNFITLLLLGLLAVWLLPVITRRTSEIVRAKPGQSAGYGFLTVIVGYAAALVAAMVIVALGLFFTVITLGGLSRTVFGLGFSSLALLVTAFTLVVSYVSKLVVAYLVGELILTGASPTLQGRRYLAMTIGVLLYALVRSIPFLGWLIGVIVTIIGMGAIWLYFRSRREQPPVEVVPAA